MAVRQPAASIVTMAPRHQAVEQAGEGRDFVALGCTRLLGQGQSLPHQEGADPVQGPRACGTVARRGSHRRNQAWWSAVNSAKATSSVPRSTASR